MPSEREEAVENRHPRRSRQLLEQTHHQRLVGRRRRHMLRAARHLRRRQPPPVQLPVRRQRQPLQHHYRRRHHVRGQPATRRRTHVGRHRGLPAGRRHVAHQLRLARRLLQHHRRLAHLGLRPQHRLHLPGLDPEPPQLHLGVHTAPEFENPVRTPPAHVPAAVHPRARRTERARDEAFRRQAGTPVISPRQVRASDVQLAPHPHRNRTQPAVQHVNRRVPQRTPDRRTRRAVAGRVQRRAHGRAHRRLGRAVRIEHAPADGES